jgi:hypothetical protein
LYSFKVDSFAVIPYHREHVVSDDVVEHADEGAWCVAHDVLVRGLDPHPVHVALPAELVDALFQHGVRRPSTDEPTNEPVVGPVFGRAGEVPDERCEEVRRAENISGEDGADCCDRSTVGGD